MKRRKTLATVLVVLAIEVGVGLAVFLIVVYSGVYNVAASRGGNPLIDWVSEATMENSVAARAHGIPVSEAYTKPNLSEGAAHYSEMCATCHGAPGRNPSEIGRGLEPHPPDLTTSLGDWPPSEVFWIVKNGVRMTGMPAFGPTLDDEKIWSIAALAKRLFGMSPETYRQLISPSASGEPGRSASRPH